MTAAASTSRQYGTGGQTPGGTGAGHPRPEQQQQVKQ